MNINRREFVKSLATFTAWGAFGGSRFAAASQFVLAGAPRLKFGVISDIHITHFGAAEDIARKGNALTFVRTLEWFRSQDVDAVAIAGDMADRGLGENLMAVSQAWYSVFPDDKYPDGRPIEKVFVTGNHDSLGAPRGYADDAELSKQIIQADIVGWWDKAFHEPYTPIYAKKIKGYTFIGAHWDGCNVGNRCHGADFGLVKDFMEKNGRGIDPVLPFFYVQHAHPKDTCYGSWAWGRDNGAVTKTLSAYPNAIAFSGHSHYSLTDERSIWQGAFTSVGTSSLSYSCAPFESHPPFGYENAGANGKDSRAINANKLMAAINGDDCRQGMLWSVYDGFIVVKRREFLSGLDLGPDWVMPLPAAEARPFAFAEHAKKLRAPEFEKGAALKVSETKAKTRGMKGVPSVEKNAFKVVAPPVVPDDKARLFELEFTAKAADGKSAMKTVLADGFNHSLKHPKAKSQQFCVFAKDELGEGEIAFSVTPINSLGTKGKTIETTWRA